MAGRGWHVLLLALLTPALAGTEARDSALRVEDVTFVSHGVTLSGSVVLPRHGRIHAAAIFIHGSGRQARDMAVARRFAAEGIGALVYDKRGAGESGGEYEAEQSVSGGNISLLADDAAAALGTLARHPSLEGVPVGVTGISQAGWIAPLAASRSRVARFLVLWSGPVCKVSEEDIYSKYTADADGEAVPPYRQALASRTETYVWPGFLGRDTDSSEDLARLSIAGLWIFGANDGSIPVDLSIARLQALKQRAHRYDYVLVPGVGHNNMEQTFAIATDWIRRLPR
jgi:pimeloyl-ACP methyl ester carboxylesterase